MEGGSGVRRRSSKTTNGGGLTPRTNPPESNPGVKKHVAQFMDMAGLAFTACKQEVFLNTMALGGVCCYSAIQHL